MPALVTAVLFRDGQESYAPFQQHASYLFDEEGWHDLGLRTLECTKRMMSLKVYAGLSLCGTRLFADHLEGTYDLARRFAERLRRTPDFDLLTEPQANIVCFRLRGADDQGRLRRRVNESGAFYLVQAGIGGETWLRVTLMNPLTTDDDLAALLDAIRLA